MARLFREVGETTSQMFASVLLARRICKRANRGFCSTFLAVPFVVIQLLRLCLNWGEASSLMRFRSPAGANNPLC